MKKIFLSLLSLLFLSGVAESAYLPTQGNIIDDGNSTTTALNDGQTFTGTWKDATGYDSVIVAAKTDQNGTFTVQFSPDCSNADSTLTKYYSTNRIEPPHRYTITRKCVRVTFTNDSGINQTYLRLQTTLGSKTPLNVPLDQTLAQDYDASPTRPTDFTSEVALGLRQGWSTWNKFGYNTAVSSAAAEAIVEWGGTLQYLTSGETITIVSADAADDFGSTGAQQIVVYGVDENWDPQTVVYNMDGLTPVVSAESWIGINRVSIYLAGTSKDNAGKITITATSSGYTMATMPVGVNSRGGGTTQQLLFYVPRDHQALASWLYLDSLKLTGGGGSPEVFFYGYVYSAVSNAEYEVYRDVLDTANENRIPLAPPEPFVIGEKSIFWVEAITDNASTSTVQGRLSLKLFRDVDAP